MAKGPNTGKKPRRSIVKRTCYAALCAALLLLTGLAVAQDVHSQSLTARSVGPDVIKTPPGAPKYCKPCLFYGGDFDTSDSNAGGLANETDLIITGSPYGAATFTPVKVPAGKTWTVTGLFTNSFNNIGETPLIDPATSYWEIRSGLNPKKDGTAGKLVAKGTTKATYKPTGRDSGFEATDLVKGIKYKKKAITLAGGKEYWFTVVSNCTNSSDSTCSAGIRYFLSDIEDAKAINAFGPKEPVDQSEFNSPTFGFAYVNTEEVCNGSGIGCDRFSAGILGTAAAK